MRLESAMRTGREGLVAHGQAISVIGDNISNANTTAYKQQRAEFVNLLAESADGRLATVPADAGDGVAVGRVRSDFDPGTTSATGRQLDVALTGAGFFLVGDAAQPALTRAGNFQINQDGFLTTSGGQLVLGYSRANPQAIGPINLKQLDIPPEPTTAIDIFGNIDGMGRISNPPANPITFAELSNEASFAATQSVYDAAGARHDVSMYYFNTAPNQWTVRAYINGEDVGQAAAQPVLLGEVALTFSNLGQIPEAQRPQAVLNLNPAWAGGVAQTPFTISLGGMTQYAGGSRISNITMDGRGTGDVISYEVDRQGSIFGITAVGDRVQAGRLAIGTVNNLDGLQRGADSTFTVTADSGALQIGEALVGGRGGVQGEALELSNVDLPQQFVDMIVYQRGYQANSQVLSAASDLIKNTIALIR
jgi:flagellar hook protein FlgE